ncbi:MAG: methyltransferase [Deltaproteobacteria bacterium]|nr:methyltransferase [Deltaproteobacteria bacterium]
MSRDIASVDDLQKLMWSFAEHRVITVAGRVGILRHLAEGSTDIAEMATELRLDPLATGKVVRALAALGLVEPEGARYRMKDSLAPHFRAGQMDLVPFLEHSHSLYDRWGENLEFWVRGEPWKGKQRDADGVRKFGEAMQAMGANVARQVAAALDLKETRRMLDVGGGFGHYSMALLRANPGLRATVLDISEVAALGREKAAGTEHENRIEFVASDYLEDDWGTGYDFVLLANVLHQELAKSAASMVRKAASALEPGGRLAVLDFSIDDAQHENLLGALFAVNMRSFGDTYPEPTIKGWMQASGLTQLTRVDLNEFRWIILGHREK